MVERTLSWLKRTPWLSTTGSYPRAHKVWLLRYSELCRKRLHLLYEKLRAGKTWDILDAEERVLVRSSPESARVLAFGEQGSISFRVGGH